MRFILSAFCLLFSVQAIAELNLSKNVEIYRGEGNLRVTLVRILPLDSNKALLEISGIDHELNGLVFNYDLTINDGNRRLTTDIYGRRYSSFVESKGWGGKSQSVYIPGQRDGLTLSFDSDASKAAKASSLLKKHKKQSAEGQLSAVQLFDREKEMKETNIVLENAEKELEQVCGKSIKVSVDWSSISDEVIKDYSVASYCGNASDAVISACGDATKKIWVGESIDLVSCEFSKSLKLKLTNKELIFKTAVDAANQGDFVRQNLLNLM